MKTMTCRALGGACDLEHHGASADDVIKAQDRHLKDQEQAGDAQHQPARDAMKSRWRHPGSRWAGTPTPRRPTQPFPRTEPSRHAGGMEPVRGARAIACCSAALGDVGLRPDQQLGQWDGLQPPR